MLNIKALKQLIADKYKNNITLFANEIGLTAGGISRILKGQRKASSDTLQRISILIKRLNLDMDDYIFFGSYVDNEQHR